VQQPAGGRKSCLFGRPPAWCCNLDCIFAYCCGRQPGLGSKLAVRYAGPYHSCKASGNCKLGLHQGRCRSCKDRTRLYHRYMFKLGCSI
jgi:hypothetical protein